MEQNLVESEERADRVLQDKKENVTTLKKDFSQVIEVAKQEISRGYADELKSLRRLVIELKNKYTDIIEQKACEIERIEAYHSQ